MRFVRSRLSWIVFGWLMCQTAGLVAAPFALCCQESSDAGLPECCQGLAPGQTCPMHHARHDDAICKMRNACVRADSALVSLAGGIGVLPAATIGVNAFAPSDRISTLTASALLRAARPEPPPPRV